MIFSSITFLYYFLPVLLLVYYIAPKSMKNIVLLLGSLVFYGWGEPKYIVLMIISIIAGYSAGRLIEIFSIKNEKVRAKAVLWTFVILETGLLVHFKFAAAFPVGISFYTFQLLSYIIDVYRGNVKAQKSMVHLAVYIAMFPQLIAGPIVRYKDIEGQLTERTYSFDSSSYGIRRFIVGLGKKVLLADQFGLLCSIFKESGDKAVLYFWLYAFSFTLQVYFDFSGYSDMAIGLGKILGFDFMENFCYPYMARSVTEFWRRWHISLGQWFRDYIYIPLGGNRVSKKRWIGNVLIVWLLTGFWHGAQWNFIIWGLYFAFFLVLEKGWIKKWLDKHRILSHLYLILVVLIGFVIFNAADLKEAADYIASIFGWTGIPLVSKEFFYYLKSYGGFLIAGILGVTPAVKHVMVSWEKKQKNSIVTGMVEILILLGIFLLSTACLVDSSFHPFLYFRF